MLHNFACWIDRVPLSIEKLHYVYIGSILKTSLVIPSLKECLRSRSNKVSERRQAQQIVRRIFLIITKARPILDHHDLLVFDLLLEAVNPNRVE
jgi:hypothetical protein